MNNDGEFHLEYAVKSQYECKPDHQPRALNEVHFD